MSRFSFPLPPIGAPHASSPECSSSLTIRTTKACFSSDYHRSAECRSRGWCSHVTKLLVSVLLSCQSGRAHHRCFQEGWEKISDFPKLLFKHVSRTKRFKHSRCRVQAEFLLKKEAFYERSNKTIKTPLKTRDLTGLKLNIFLTDHVWVIKFVGVATQFFPSQITQPPLL